MELTPEHIEILKHTEKNGLGASTTLNEEARMTNAITEYTYRKSVAGEGYEIGERDTPRTHPGEWCDRRLRKVWGNERKAFEVTKSLNQCSFGRFNYCPVCGASVIQPRTLDDYCEECGWPDEVRGDTNELLCRSNINP